MTEAVARHFMRQLGIVHDQFYTINLAFIKNSGGSVFMNLLNNFLTFEHGKILFWVFSATGYLPM